MPTIITPLNCGTPEVLQEYADYTNSEQKTAARSVIWNYCKQNGMQKLPHPSSGIETVITFIDNLIKDKQ